jgi:hypothetical protein
MNSTGLCPKCGKLCATVIIEEVALSHSVSRSSFKGANYLCPHCKTILSVSMDPFAYKNDVAAAVLKLMKGQK